MTESPRMKEDLELHLTVQLYLLPLKFISVQSLRKTKSPSSILCKAASRNIHRNALNSGGWIGDLIIADRRDIENNVASEAHVKRFKSEEVGIKKLQGIFFLKKFLCADGSQRHAGHAQRHTLRQQRVEYPQLWARGHPLQRARIHSLQREGGVADVSEADRDAVEAREISRVCLWIHRHHVMPREQLYEPKESSFPIPSKSIHVLKPFGREYH